MNFEQAQDNFLKLLDQVSDEDKAQFLIWIERSYFVSQCRGTQPAEARSILQNIAEDLKKIVPFEGVLPSEKLVAPTSKENGEGYDAKHTVHVDSFLYQDPDLDDLEREGKLHRSYCKDCDSRNIAPLTFISHSCSIDRMDFIFSSFLPYLEGKTVLDVGSRLGALLYGAYVYTPAPKIIGVEMNKDWVEITQKMIEKYNMKDRIEVICDNICNLPDIVRKADVVLLNNVFEFFCPVPEQERAWNFLQKNVKSGAILLTVPSLEDSIKHLKVDFDLKTWVKAQPVTDPLLALSMETQPEISQVCVYTVL